MQGLRAIALIAATLLLIGGGVGAGYYARGNTSANETSAALKPAPVPNFPGTLKMSMDDGSVCTVDFEGKTSTCTFPDGARQTMSVSDGDIHINTIALGEDDKCSVFPMGQPIENATLGHVDLATVAANTTERLMRPGTQSKRVNSWVIAVPESLRAAAGVDEVTEFEYFEKDGKAWKAEFFAEGKEDPTVVRFDASNDAVPATKCTSATEHARAILKRQLLSDGIGSTAAAETATALFCSKSLGLVLAFGAAACVSMVLMIALPQGLCGDKKGPKLYQKQGGRNWGENCWEACEKKSGMCQFCSTHTKKMKKGEHGGACCRTWGSYGVSECYGQGPVGYHGCSRDATNKFSIGNVMSNGRRRLGNLRQVANISAGMVDFDMLSTAATAAATAAAAAVSSQLIEAIAN